jgi:hypothetical protein
MSLRKARARGMMSITRRSVWGTLVISLCLGVLTSAASLAEEQGLALEQTISLGMVAGRIDHLAIDLARKRLFVSELGANSSRSSTSIPVR